MPLPKPEKKEPQQKFIARCTGDEIMLGEYPDEKQRAAVCYSQWEAAEEKAKKKIAASRQRTPHFSISKPLHLIEHSPVAVSLAAVKISNGKPVQRFRKELIHTGQYVKESDNIEFEVTENTLKHWAATFSQMKKAGLKVPILLQHINNPEANRGYAHDMFVDGDSLIGILDLIGEDGIALAGRTDVSIYSPPDYVDGKGNKYLRPITHVALCTDPVIPGLGDWKEVAASLTRKEEFAMQWTKIQEALGLEEPLTDETAVETILSYLDAMKKKLAELQEADEKEAAAVAAAKTAADKPEPDPLLIKLALENRHVKLAQLVQAGRITPAVKDKLVEQFATEKTLALSLRSGRDDKFDALIAILAENDPVELKEQTGPQTLQLAHPAHPSSNLLIADAERRAKAAKEGIPY